MGWEMSADPPNYLKYNIESVSNLASLGLSVFAESHAVLETLWVR